jgi:hypothetical protein
MILMAKASLQAAAKGSGSNLLLGSSATNRSRLSLMNSFEKDSAKASARSKRAHLVWKVMSFKNEALVPPSFTP